MYVLLKRPQYFRGAKIVSLSHMAKTCVAAVGMWGEMMMRKDVSKIDFMVLAVINVVYVVI